MPDGYSADQRGQPGGFVGDPDVMDTWATSSLTPQIVCGWPEDPDLFARMFPMDLRPQAHDIIRTWLFDTVLRAHLEHDSLPWTNAAISGWVLDPDRKKMSKSKGNVVTPLALLEEHGSDGVRYWAASGRPGADTAFDTKPDAGRPAAGDQAAERVEVRAGRSGTRGAVTAGVDRGMLTNLARLVAESTDELEAYDYARVLQRTETSLLALLRRLPRAREGAAVRRAGRSAAASANAALLAALSVMLRLFAPFLPFVTEEVWSWWRAGSVHQAAWPADRDPCRRGRGRQPRRRSRCRWRRRCSARSASSNPKRRPLKMPIARVVVRAPADQLDVAADVEQDLRAARPIQQIDALVSEELQVDVELRAPEGVPGRPE